MAFNVRIFGHAGLIRMRVVNAADQFSSDSVYQLQQPYLWRETLTTNGLTAVSSAVQSTPAGQTQDKTSVLRIEVPDSQAIRYEVNPPGRSTSADSNSPIMSGHNQVQFGAGWTISIIDASGT